jgi:hypothetical protein
MDKLVNNCIVGNTASGWCWLCPDCGAGGLASSEFKYERANEVVKEAEKHQCQPVMSSPS